MKNYGWLLCFNVVLVYSQQVEQAEVQYNSNGKIRFARYQGADETRSLHRVKEFLQKELKLSDNDNLNLIEADQDNFGMHHQSYQMLHKGLKVEGIILKAHGKNYVEVINGNTPQLNIEKVNPTIDASEAINSAIKHVGAKKYSWQVNSSANITSSVYPKPELVIASDYTGENWQLAWKIEIDAVEPISSQQVFVNAHNGQILNSKSLICYADAAVHTQYNGVKTVQANQISGGPVTYQLQENRNGVTVTAYDCLGGPDYYVILNYLIGSSTSVFNSPADRVAYDAYWGAEQVLDYWRIKHNRNSTDGNGLRIQIGVHVENLIDNAYWKRNTISMYFGSGSNNNPWSALDVVAHEFGHGINQYEGDLEPVLEAGAINESLSDIWGEVIQY